MRGGNRPPAADADDAAEPVGAHDGTKAVGADDDTQETVGADDASTKAVDADNGTTKTVGAENDTTKASEAGADRSVHAAVEGPGQVHEVPPPPHGSGCCKPGSRHDSGGGSDAQSY